MSTLASESAPTSRSLRLARQVLEIESAAIAGLLDQLDERFDEAIELIRQARGRVICTGMGKSGHVMGKVAATLSSTGTPALFVHPAEAIHGDLGMITTGDVVLAASSSGTTEEILAMMAPLEERAVPTIAITGNPQSPLAQRARIHLPAVIDKEACPLNLAPTASTTATLALGDALAMTLLAEHGFTSEDFAHLHPGGDLGRRLRRVDTLMHVAESVPRVSPSAPLKQAISEMSRCALGIVGVVDGDRLVGVFSDGDLRRLMTRAEAADSGFVDQPIERLMVTSPKTCAPSERAQDALKMMEEHRITTLFVVAEAPEGQAGKLAGVVHIHDLWGQRRIVRP